MKQSLRGWAERRHYPSFWISVWFGAGLLRPAPGTWGSLVASLMAGVAYALGVNVGVMMIAIFVVTLLGILTIEQIQRQSGIHDAPEIVIDEVAGQWIAVLPIMQTNLPFTDTFLLFAAAFALFRLFDVVKPWPIRVIDRSVQGGFGVMVDDLIAGFIAFLGVKLLLIGFYL